MRFTIPVLSLALCAAVQAAPVDTSSLTDAANTSELTAVTNELGARGLDLSGLLGSLNTAVDSLEKDVEDLLAEVDPSLAALVTKVLNEVDEVVDEVEDLLDDGKKNNSESKSHSWDYEKSADALTVAVDDLQSLVEQLVSTLIDPELTEDVQGILTLVDNIISEVGDAL